MAVFVCQEYFAGPDDDIHHERSVADPNCKNAILEFGTQITRRRLRLNLPVEQRRKWPQQCFKRIHSDFVADVQGNNTAREIVVATACETRVAHHAGECVLVRMYA